MHCLIRHCKFAFLYSSAAIFCLFTGWLTSAAAFGKQAPAVQENQEPEIVYTSDNPRDLQDPPSKVAGHKVEWEGWDFEWQFREIEGLVLKDVYFRDIKVLKYLGLAEIYVPYATGSPRPVDFSLGGFKANPMPIEVERDCYAQGRCRALNKDGSQAEGKFADVMIHEDDTGFAYAGALGRSPGKKLVLWSMCHFAGPGDGYTYVIRWKFFNDGRIRAEVGATGGLQHLNITKHKARSLVVGKDSKGKSVFAPSHVHNFYFRVDLDVDGEENSAQELNYINDATKPMRSKAVWKNVERETGFYTNPKTFRSWRVLNPNSLNAQGRPRSYHIVNASGGSWRDGDTYKVLRPDIMFTKYGEKEFPYSSVDATRALLALGNYLNNERIVEEDVVVWQRISFMHLPRSEDWIAQPIVWHGFDMIPRDFLDTSPLTATK